MIREISERLIEKGSEEAARFRISNLLVVGLFLIYGFSAVSHAEDEEAFHAFTDKQGRNVTARVLSVSPDRKVITIADQSGNNYDLVIVKLSLDDQQYLKDWMANRAASLTYRLDVKITKISADTKKRQRAFSFRSETEFPAYRVNVSNLSRDTLRDATMEYLIVKRDRVKIYRTPPPNSRLTYDRIYDKDQGPVMIWKEHELGDLAFNHDQEIVTDSMEIDQVFEEGATSDAEDFLLGMIVRIRDGLGNVIGDFYSADPGISGKKWESFVADQDSVVGQSFLKTRVLPDMPDSLQQGDAVEADDVPQLAGKSVRITAYVTLDSKEDSGVLFQWGGNSRGLAIEIQDRRLRWWVRRMETADAESKAVESSVRVADLPEGEFLLEVTLDSKKMTISINGVESNERESPGLLTDQPNLGITVSHQDSTAVAPRSSARNFTGRIRDLRVILTD